MLEQIMAALKARGLTDDDIQSIIEEARVKTQVAQIVGQFVRQIVSIGWQDGFGQASLQITIAEDENGNLVGWHWQFTGQHGKVGTIDISGKVDLPTQPPTQQEPTQVEQTTRSRSNWSRVIDLAQKYGIEVKPYERRAISWYAGVILNRIAKQNPTAKQDPEFTTLVQEWNANKSQNAPEAKV